MRTVDIAWAAGFLEGEGSFGISRVIVVSAVQINDEPLKRLQELFGGTIHDTPTLKGDKRIHYWRVYSERAAEVMMTVFSLMSRKRQQQIVKCLARWRATGPNNDKKTHCPQGHVYDRFYQAKDPNLRVQHYRYCGTCHNEAARKWTANNRATRNQRRRDRRRERGECRI